MNEYKLYACHFMAMIWLLHYSPEAIREYGITYG
jgi:hypothetical protein